LHWLFLRCKFGNQLGPKLWPRRLGEKRSGFLNKLKLWRCSADKKCSELEKARSIESVRKLGKLMGRGY